MLIRPNGLALVSNFAHGSEVRKAYWHTNKRILNLIAIMKEVYNLLRCKARQKHLSLFLCPPPPPLLSLSYKDSSWHSSCRSSLPRCLSPEPRFRRDLKYLKPIFPIIINTRVPPRQQATITPTPSGETVDQQKCVDQDKRLFFPPIPRFLFEQPFGLMALGNERQVPRERVAKRMQQVVFNHVIRRPCWCTKQSQMMAQVLHNNSLIPKRQFSVLLCAPTWRR